MDDDIGDRQGSVAGKTGRNAWISTRRETGEAVGPIHVGGRGPASQSDRHAADWIARARICNRTLQRATHSRRAAGKAECANAGVVGQPGDLVVTIRVPEGAAIPVKGHGAVVAAACTGSTARAGLRAGPFNKRLLRLRD